ncbi:MAG: hypothetical protein CL610_01845 [Anaerolineaceae bacterium]|nr:hypothetical protein [Anaerolineaceae bacterium]
MTIRGSFVIIAVMVLIAGCQPAAETPVLPTALDLNMLATSDAATAMAIASPTRRPLPPTFTPSPLPSATPTDPASVPTATPEGFRADGTIYYLINGDAIVELAADGSFEDLLPIPHIGQNVSDLTLSPDGLQMAYVGPGAGSAREVYITDRSGTNTRQLSNLGFSEIQPPVWKPDGTALAFIAAQGPEAPRGIYVVNADASGQRAVIQLPSLELRDLVWGGDWLYFSDQTIYAVNQATGALTESLTQFTGYGSDFSPEHSPTQPELYYLKTRFNRDTGQRGGVLASFDTSEIPELPVERPGAELYVESLRYGPNGDFLLIAGEEGVWVQDQTLQTATKILQDVVVDPRPVLSPDSESVAYISLDAAGVEQIYLVNRRGGEPVQITFHQEGIITDLNWVAG